MKKKYKYYPARGLNRQRDCIGYRVELATKKVWKLHATKGWRYAGRLIDA